MRRRRRARTRFERGRKSQPTTSAEGSGAEAAPSERDYRRAACLAEERSRVARRRARSRARRRRRGDRRARERRGAARAPGRGAGETHVTSRLEAPPAARAATGATAPNAHDVLVAASPLLSSFSSPGEARGTTARPRTPSTAAAHRDSHGRRAGRAAAARRVREHPRRRRRRDARRRVVAAARSPSGASASAASPPPTPSSAASGGVSHVASVRRRRARGPRGRRAKLPSSRRTRRRTGAAGTRRRQTNHPPDGDSKNASPERRRHAPLRAGTPAATRETRGGASRAKTTACAVTPPCANRWSHWIRTHARTATKTASAAWDASKIDDDGARDARREGERNRRAVARVETLARGSPVLAAGGGVRATRPRRLAARRTRARTAEGTTARISAAETTDKTSADVVQLETSREDSAKPIPEPATTRRAPGLEAGETHVVAAKRAPMASASRGAPTSGPIVPTRHADAGVATPGSPADAEKARVTTSPVPPSSAASRGAKVTARGASWYANGADSATEGSRARGRSRGARRASRRERRSRRSPRTANASPRSRGPGARGAAAGSPRAPAARRRRTPPGRRRRRRRRTGRGFARHARPRAAAARRRRGRGAARTAARSTRSHSGPRASRASRVEAASASSTYSRTTVRLPCAS